MAAFGNYLEDKITGWINGTDMGTAPTNTYVQLFNGNPTDTGTGGTALLSRVAVAAGGWTRGTGGAGTLTNTDPITITSSSGSAVTADYFAVFDAATGGNLIFHGQLTPSAGKVISVGDEVKFNASQLTLTVA